MREIFCRGKNRNDHKWIYGYYVKYCQDYEFIFQDDWIQETHKYKDNGNTTLKGAFEVIPETAGQYTGLTDKNGKKIFEGDLLSSSEWSCLCEVIWDGGGFTIKQGETTQNLKTNLEDYYGNEFEVEVVGNIHDIEVQP